MRQPDLGRGCYNLPRLDHQTAEKGSKKSISIHADKQASLPQVLPMTDHGPTLGAAGQNLRRISNIFCMFDWFGRNIGSCACSLTKIAPFSTLLVIVGRPDADRTFGIRANFVSSRVSPLDGVLSNTRSWSAHTWFPRTIFNLILQFWDNFSAT